MTELDDQPQEVEEGPVVDPQPDGGIGGDESEHVPTEGESPAEDDTQPADDGEQPDEPPEGDPTEVFESLGDAPVDDEDGSGDQGDGGGEADGS